MRFLRRMLHRHPTVPPPVISAPLPVSDPEPDRELEAARSRIPAKWDTFDRLLARNGTRAILEDFRAGDARLRVERVRK